MQLYYIDDSCEEYDVCFISEHWFRPHELAAVRSQWKSSQRWAVMKSSMDPEMIHKARSHSGVSFKCKKRDKNSFRPVDTKTFVQSGYLYSQSAFLTNLFSAIIFIIATLRYLKCIVKHLKCYRKLYDKYGDCA